jgi:cytochrome c oxidase cbb3-type subunit 3
MMKNIKYYLENETGVDVFGLFSLVIFFLFFVGLLIYVYRMNRTEIDELKNIPLKDDENKIS